MDKNKECFGIDISKETFDVYTESLGSLVYKNKKEGFAKFVRELDEGSYCVMEATGYYHHQLAYYLLEKGITVVVENPLKIKRFIQMGLTKVKTDKSDAKMICLYGERVETKPWKGNTIDQRESYQLVRLLDSYQKQTTVLKNKIHGEQALGEPSKAVIRSLQRSLKYIKEEVKKVELRLDKLVKKDNQDLLTRLESIPGIGRRTATMLIVSTDSFERFESASALCSFAGLTPVIRTSGTSVHSRARISKAGNRKLRSLLFLCSMTACQHNKACKALFDRIVAKGKSKKLALIAVCNKLLKQSFAIAKSGLYYDSEYVSIKPN